MTSLLYCRQGVLVVHRCVLFAICSGTDDYQLLVQMLFRTFLTDFTGHCHEHALYCDFTNTGIPGAMQTGPTEKLQVLQKVNVQLRRLLHAQFVDAN